MRYAIEFYCEEVARAITGEQIEVPISISGQDSSERPAWIIEIQKDFDKFEDAFRDLELVRIFLESLGVREHQLLYQVASSWRRVIPDLVSGLERENRLHRSRRSA